MWTEIWNLGCSSGNQSYFFFFFALQLTFLELCLMDFWYFFLPITLWIVALHFGKMGYGRCKIFLSYENFKFWYSWEPTVSSSFSVTETQWQYGKESANWRNLSLNLKILPSSLQQCRWATDVSVLCVFVSKRQDMITQLCLVIFLHGRTFQKNCKTDHLRVRYFSLFVVERYIFFNMCEVCFSVRNDILSIHIVCMRMLVQEIGGYEP